MGRCPGGMADVNGNRPERHVTYRKFPLSLPARGALRSLTPTGIPPAERPQTASTPWIPHLALPLSANKESVTKEDREQPESSGYSGKTKQIYPERGRHPGDMGHPSRTQWEDRYGTANAEPEPRAQVLTAHGPSLALQPQ